jgi:SAM-dependent methyltransferase
MRDAYIFDHADDDTECRRLQALESFFDPYTVARIDRLDIRPGAACLEVGPGAGSIFRHMAAATGRFGWVTAVDINPRFVTAVAQPDHASWEVIVGDIADGAGAGVYDIAHARHVMQHQPDPDKAIAAMAAALKPGGRILIEDSDYTSIMAADRGHRRSASFEATLAAMGRSFTAHGIDPAFGATLPGRLVAAGLVEVESERIVYTVKGNGPLARLMGETARHLAPALISEANADPADVGGYIDACFDPGFVAHHDCVVAAWGVKP